MSIISLSFAKDSSNEFNNAVIAYKNKDFFVAFELFDKLCKNGNLVACNNLGILYDNGYGTRQSYQKAFEIYKNLCDKKISIGCYNLGAMYSSRLAVETVDREKALDFFGKGCDYKSTISCERYALFNKSKSYISDTNREFIFSEESNNY